jgi:hypothetical protein
MGWGIEKHVQILVEKSECKRPFGRNRHRWENNIRMDLKDHVMWVPLKVRVYGISNHGHLTRGGPPAWGLSKGLTTSHRTKLSCYKMLHGALENKSKLHSQRN